MGRSSDCDMRGEYLEASVVKAVAEQRCFEQAEKAVKAYEKNSDELNSYLRWQCCSFKFVRTNGLDDPETAFGFFFSQLFEQKMRARLLLINFFYMLYATAEWGTRSLGFAQSLQKRILFGRSLYVGVNLVIFVFSFCNRRYYRRKIMHFSAFLRLFTAAMIINEGYMLDIIYSPCVVFLLLAYMVTSNVLVGTHFWVSTVICWSNLLMYDFVCVILCPGGDRNIRAPRIARKWLIWYNVFFILFILPIMYMTKRVEARARYSFIMHYYGLSENCSSDPKTQHKVVDKEPVCRQCSCGLKKDSCTKSDSLESSPLLGCDCESGASASDPGPGFETWQNGMHWAHGHSLFQDVLEEIRKDIGGGKIGEKISNSENKVQSFIEYLQLAKEKMIPKDCKPRLANYKDLPSYYHRYPHIINGYRLHYSVKDCGKSLFQMHNEFVNIWTEFGPMVACTIALILSEVYDTAMWENISVFDGFLTRIALFIILVLRPLCSGLAHLFHCVSERSYLIWWAIDYASIAITILFQSLVFGRFTFYCMESQQIFYYISVSGLFFSTLISVLFVASANVRTYSFLLYVLFAAGVPLAYQVMLKMTPEMPNHHNSDVPLEYLCYWAMLSGTFFLSFLVRGAQLPEAACEGKVDNVLSSHQIWHILVNSGNAMAYVVWRKYLIWRATHPCVYT